MHPPQPPASEQRQYEKSYSASANIVVCRYETSHSANTKRRSLPERNVVVCQHGTPKSASTKRDSLPVRNVLVCQYESAIQHTGGTVGGTGIAGSATAGGTGDMPAKEA